ncbi:MAG: sigma-70 family RNA polymerase sigma factor [Chloroflexi bacterium]|nr:sigma-70 family RNA polymerase sigma factor [Chloroflexota bacterium]
MHDLSDAELVERAQYGDLEAVGLLYDRHRTPIFRYVRARIYDTHLAQDLTGEVFLQMVAHLEDYQITAVPFSAWLYRIAHNHIVNYIGRKENQYQHVSLFEAGNLNQREANPARLVERQLTLEAVQQALERIDETQREIIILRFWLGYSLKEVATMLDKTVAAVKSHQHRGLLALEMVMK